ncbi:MULTISPECIES: GMC oxidoreductase [unclassified Achromobacter]|uniref:GMC oxidoreductase n=1 Tax=unclassified Achromobacter TaxID=2626865 RepID=UPI000B51C36B|nr:hypothetical protein CEY04_18560 [Achromobacter sp. HZ28]OWT76233.1 hypothetical protein CEY05_14010 [Achromobacter sp. HZ34]
MRVVARVVAADPTAVVDQRLRVIGLRGLRIADASIIPQTPSASTCAAAMMVGERAADMIREDGRRSSWWSFIQPSYIYRGQQANPPRRGSIRE